MKTLMKMAVVGALLTRLPVTFAQDWHANFPSGNPILGTEYLGCDATSTQPMRIKTVPDLVIDMYTRDIRRFTLLPDATYTVGSFAGQVKDGCLLHGPNVDQFYSLGGPGPFSIDHVAAADDNAEQQYYRPWMHVGTTYTGNKDQGYVGQKAGEESGKTDMVLHFGGPTDGSQDNHMRAIYTTGYSGATTGARSLEGLEFLRLWPRDNDQPHVGIGDWYAANINSGGLINEPEERLDVVNGNVRVRDLPTQPQSSSTDVVVVAANGNLEHRPAASLLSGDCDWTIEFQGTSGSAIPHDVYTAVGSSDDCPDIQDAVGIGISQPVYKLDVKHSDLDAQRSGGLRVDVETNNAGWRSGISTTIQPASGGAALAFATGVSSIINNVGLGQAGTADSYGVFARSSTSNNLFLRKSIGVYGDAVASVGTHTSLWGAEFSARGTGAAATEGIGVYARATNTTGTMTDAFGVWATASGATNNFAGWFQGDIMVTGTPFSTLGGMFTASDESLKSDIQPISSATDVLAQLEPKTYSFLTAEYPQMNLPQGVHAGFIAQEVEAVLPQLVKGLTFPAQRDTSGAQTSDAVPIKTLNYTGLIPYLVAAFQEQKARTDELEEQLALCCSNGGQRSVQADVPTTLETDLRIIPNPVADQTELRYTVGVEGRIRLEIMDASGRMIQTQDEGTRATGTFSFGWDTTALSAGTYFCTLFVNDEPLVKRAVKLNAR